MVGENIYMVSTSEDFVLASGPNEWFYRHNKKDGEAIKLLLTIACRRRIYLLFIIRFIIERDSDVCCFNRSTKVASEIQLCY